MKESVGGKVERWLPRGMIVAIGLALPSCVGGGAEPQERLASEVRKFAREINRGDDVMEVAEKWCPEVLVVKGEWDQDPVYRVKGDMRGRFLRCFLKDEVVYKTGKELVVGNNLGFIRSTVERERSHGRNSGSWGSLVFGYSETERRWQLVQIYMDTANVGGCVGDGDW